MYLAMLAMVKGFHAKRASAQNTELAKKRE